MTVAKGDTCSIGRCKGRKVPGLSWCNKHTVKKCDEIFSRIIRAEGRCVAEYFRDRAVAHNGNLQCAHGFSRSYKAVRWDRRNAFCLCAAHHTYYTHHPIEWDLWLLDRWGIETYAEIRDLALTHRTPDLELVLAELKAAA